MIEKNFQILFNRRNFVISIYAAITFLFYLWSGLFIISFVLTFVIDSLTFGFFSSIIKRHTSKILYSIFKTIYLVILPLSVIIFIRTFLVDIYFVPSNSMRDTLESGDYILINKVLHGTKIPNTIQDIPVLGSFIKYDQKNKDINLYRSLSGFKKFERNVVVVFKSVENHNEFLVKRIIGLPGEQISIRKSDVLVDKDKIDENLNYRYDYKIGGEVLNLSNVDYMKLSSDEKSLHVKKNDTNFFNNKHLFPFIKSNGWTMDNYGPLLIPKKGMKIILDKNNYNIYKDIIRRYEKSELKVSNLLGKPYTFTNDYYFLLGDNRHHSIDSRVFGFIPENYVLGSVLNSF